MNDGGRHYEQHETPAPLAPPTINKYFCFLSKQLGTHTFAVRSINCSAMKLQAHSNMHAHLHAPRGTHKHTTREQKKDTSDMLIGSLITFCTIALKSQHLHEIKRTDGRAPWCMAITCSV